MTILMTDDQLEGMLKKVLADFAGRPESGESVSPIEIISTEELSKRLNISVPTIIRMRKQKKIPYMPCGTAIRFNWHSVVKALEKN